LSLRMSISDRQPARRRKAPRTDWPTDQAAHDARLSNGESSPLLAL